MTPHPTSSATSQTVKLEPRQSAKAAQTSFHHQQPHQHQPPHPSQITHQASNMLPQVKRPPSPYTQLSQIDDGPRKRNKFTSADIPLLPLPGAPTAFGAREFRSSDYNTPANSPYNYHQQSHHQAPGSQYSSQLPPLQAQHLGGSTASPANTNLTSHNSTSSSANGSVSFPTPAPTTISDEDVAMQLIRLGDPSLSPLKCPSPKASPMPVLTTAMQLKALHDGVDFASVQKQYEQQQKQLQQNTAGSNNYPSSPPSSVEEREPMVKAPAAKKRTSNNSSSTLHARTGSQTLITPPAHSRNGSASHSRTNTHTHTPPLPNSNSIETLSAGSTEDKNGLGRSIGVRCIRCKKSKKGCDRQRPCGRCVDADEECITEDEGSGRKRGSKKKGHSAASSSISSTKRVTP
ncbi:hypothetical protein PYCC9005_002360 [Savitreella phatthalungensis]